jgi:hypothetical protein
LPCAWAFAARVADTAKCAHSGLTGNWRSEISGIATFLISRPWRGQAPREFSRGAFSFSRLGCSKVDARISFAPVNLRTRAVNELLRFRPCSGQSIRAPLRRNKVRPTVRIYCIGDRGRRQVSTLLRKYLKTCAIKSVTRTGRARAMLAPGAARLWPVEIPSRSGAAALFPFPTVHHPTGVLVDKPTKGRAPRPPRSTTRAERRAANEAAWRQKMLQRQGRPGRPRPIRPAEIIQALDLFHAATRDPVFALAADALRRYGFGTEPARTAARMLAERYGDPRDAYTVQVQFLTAHGLLDADTGRRRRLSIHEACEHVAAEAGLPGQSFVTVVEDLRRRCRLLPATQAGVSPCMLGAAAAELLRRWRRDVPT